METGIKNEFEQQDHSQTRDRYPESVLVKKSHTQKHQSE
jgi:hypothetical protein